MNTPKNIEVDLSNNEIDQITQGIESGVPKVIKFDIYDRACVKSMRDTLVLDFGVSKNNTVILKANELIEKIEKSIGE